MNTPIAKFDRPFQVWEYVVSHRQLLLRSPKSRSSPTNIDLVFRGVRVMHLRHSYPAIRLRRASAEEQEAIERAAGGPESHVTAHLLLGDGLNDGFVLCVSFEVRENTLDLHQTGLDFTRMAP
jgi:hypothetical protein